VEWAQERAYKRAYARVDTNFEEWMTRKIAAREKENRKAPAVRGSADSDFVLFTSPAGTATKDAGELVRREFAANPELVLVYGDEDVPKKRRSESEEYEPWLKPMWSPALFLSCFYFGNFFAIRKSVYQQWKRAADLTLEQAVRESNADEVERMLFLENWSSVKPDRNGDVHLRPGENDSYFMEKEEMDDLRSRSMMRYHYRMCYEILSQSGAFGQYGAKKVCHIPEILFHDASSMDIRRIFDVGALKFQGQEAVGEEQRPQDLISIIIPSKDHPDILERCIASLREETDEAGLVEAGIKIEIIVVDNGSTARNRNETQRLAEKYNFCYFYEPMEFNFSRMCNLGVERSHGSYILLLNDDMEIIQSNWLAELVRRARMPFAGAVGAKLLYPGTTLIQHAGVTNIRLGPTHKLLKKDDMQTYYFGQNRMVHDMLAVTGACLLVKRGLYEQVGGLSEELRVAFNDVDFCFKLHELGYSNVQCNDVLLYHHESLSRGNDLEDEDKTRRLQAEMDKLFELHPGLCATDPYYSKYMTTDVAEVGFAYYFQSVSFERMVQHARPQPLQGSLERAREDDCVNYGVEYHDKLKGWLGKTATETPEDIYIQGHSFIIGSNNACYERKLLFREETSHQIYEVRIRPQYRPDIAKKAPDQQNVELCGFSVQLPKGSLPAGNYRIGIYARKRLAREEILRWTVCWLKIKEE